MPRNWNPSVSNIDWQAAASISLAFTKRGAELACPTLKTTIINSDWLSLLQDRKQQQKRLCCPWKKKCLRQTEYLSLYDSVPYMFLELCASECARACANRWPVLNVETREVSMSTGQCQVSPVGSRIWCALCSTSVGGRSGADFSAEGQPCNTRFLWLLFTPLQKHTWE